MSMPVEGRWCAFGPILGTWSRVPAGRSGVGAIDMATKPTRFQQQACDHFAEALALIAEGARLDGRGEFDSKQPPRLFSGIVYRQLAGGLVSPGFLQSLTT